jgi:hypothetical protein
MQPTQPQIAARNNRLVVALPLMLAVLAAYFFAVRVWHGMRFVGFVDESEHLLGGKILNEGAILYRTFVTQHGPVTFMLTQAYGAIFGWRHANGARVISAALALGAASCVATTPALSNRVARLWATALFLGLIATVWIVQGLYLVNYHAIAGFLLVAALAMFVVPAWCGAPVGRARAGLAGACCTLVIATAYSFGPAIVLLGASALWAMALRPVQATGRSFIAGAALAGLLVLAWLLMFGDLLGFLAFHFAENQFVFVHFMPFTFGNFLRSLMPSWQPWALVQSFAVLGCAVSFCLLLVIDLMPPRKHLTGPILLGLAGVLALDARGSLYFQNGSFLIGSIALLSMALPAAVMRFMPAPGPIGVAAGTLLMGLCVIGAELAGRYAVSSPVPATRAEIVAMPRVGIGLLSTPEFVRIRELVRPDEHILAVPYAPGVYMSADRMPMDRYFYYLPWDAAYANVPWFGRSHDLCADLPNAPPRLIYLDRYLVWDRYDIRDYAPCLFAFLKAYYRRQTDFPDLYVRADQGSDAPAQQ